VLARQMNIERYEYKAMIYKLKRLSLTYSLDVGYSISPRGRAYLRLTSGDRSDVANTSDLLPDPDPEAPG
jgi:hypothetical protein